MHLTAIMPAKNEGWVIGLSARAALMYCDDIVILDHESTDDTPSIIEKMMVEYPGRVNMFQVFGPWKEMDHRQSLLDFARAIGATHIANVDADEVLAGDMLPTIRTHIQALAPGTFLGITMRNLHRSIGEFRSDHSPFGSMAGTMLAFADAAPLGWDARGGYDHHSRAPHGSRMGAMLKSGGGLMHLQFASWRRLVAKHRAYRVLERTKYPTKSIPEIERLYSMATNEDGLKLASVPNAWWEPYVHLLRYLDLERVPWQEQYVEDAIHEYGSDYFAGLRVFNGQIA